jgi:hypothetical protein
MRAAALPASLDRPRVDRTRPTLDRLGALKWRTLAVALAALLCGWGALHGVLAPAARLALQGIDALRLRRWLPALDVPAWSPGFEWLGWVPSTAFLLIAALVIIGFSAGRFGRAPARLVMLPLALLGLVVVVWGRAGGVPEGALQRQALGAALLGHYDAAERALADGGAPALTRHYLGAQLALRADDRAALRAHGLPLLDAVDQVLYAPGETSIDPALRLVLRFEPAVLHAIDVALHDGRPRREIGLQWEADHAGGSGRLRQAAALVAVPLGALLLGAALALVRLWNTMRRRVARLQVELVPDTDPPVGTAPAPAETARASLDRVGFAGLRRWLRLAALGLFGFGMLQTLTLRLSAGLIHDAAADQRTSIADQEARLTGGDMQHQPCGLVGVWTAARRHSVYQVTLQDTGRFHAEPLARGTYSGAPIHGDWSVDTAGDTPEAGQRITWHYDSGVPAGPPDVNPVRDLSATGFTLVEVNGETTRYNLIRRTPGPRCPASH